jgi:2-dehydro-3-deoxy-D-arabinonate dehydratase
MWFADGRALPPGVSLGNLLGVKRAEMALALAGMSRLPIKVSHVLSPAEDDQEIWAAGVTYLRSRDERQAESIVADVYGRVYEAERPELFFKSVGWRTVGSGQKIRIRRDSDWNVPEPELTLVVNSFGEIVGYTAGNDVSSRRIEGENPLYLPQAKTYDGSCALGPGIVLCEPVEMEGLSIRCSIKRRCKEVFGGEANMSQMKRKLNELVQHLFRETSFPRGVVLMTGTGIVPAEGFTLRAGDEVTIQVGELTLVNEVDSHR